MANNKKTVKPINGNTKALMPTSASELKDFQSKIKLIEKKLQSSQEKYQNLVDNALVGIYQTDIEGNILFANKALCEMLEFESEKELKADGAIARYVNPKDRYRFINILNEKGKIVNFETDLYTKNNQVISVIVSAELSGTTISGMVRDISEIKKAEHILVDSEEKYRTLAEAAQDMIFIIDKEGFVRYVNSFAAKQFNLKPQQIIGENIKKLFPSKATKHQLENIKKVFKTGKPLYVENKTEFPEGEIWLGTWLVPLIKDVDEVYSIQGVSRDITAQKQAEEELKERELILAEAQRISSFGSWKFDIKKNELYWSEQTYKIYGVFPKKFKLTQESLLKLIVPEDRHLMENWSRLAIQGKKMSPLEFRVKRSDGEIHTLLGTGETFFDDQNELSHIIGTVYDITERKHAEEALRLDHEIMTNINDGVYLVRASDGVILWANRQFEKMFGYKPGELAGKHMSIVNAPAGETSEEITKKIIEELNKRGIWRGETLNIKKDGTTFWCDASVTSSTLEYPNYGAVWVSVHRDITERKQAEENQKHTIQRLKGQNKRLAALNIVSGQLSFISNDLNEMLRKSLNITLSALGFDGGSAHLYSDYELSRVLAHAGVSEKLLKWIDQTYVASINNKKDKKWAANQAILFSKPVLVEDISKYYKGATKKILLEEGFVSVAVIPLTHQGGCLGIIIVASKEKKKEELFEFDFLDMIGKQIGMAISNNILSSKIINAKRDWETTFDSISDPITIHDKDFNIVRANKATAKYLNIEMNQIIGEKCYKLFHGLDQPVQGCPAKVTMKFWDDASLALDDQRSKKSISINTSSIIENNELKNIIHIIKDVTVQKATAKSLLEATENQRKDISEEIHDSMLQLLYGASIYCRKAIKSNCCDSDYLNEAIKLIEESMDAGRRLITGIRPPMLENLGLAHSLRDYANNLFKGTEISLDMQFEKKLKKSDIDVVVYRIAQEILMNVYKHSKAENVKMKLFELSSELFLTVRDDGIGFKPDKNFFKEKTISGHIGLQSVIEKTEMYGGQCLITSKPKRGTTIEIIIPKPVM